MNIIELLDEYITEEAYENSLILLDIDQTLLVPNNIFIYRKLPSDEREVSLTPEEYAKEKTSAETKKYYDYRDFRDAEKVGNSIKTGIPIVSNLKIMDEYVKKGWRIGILTARGMEDVIFKSLKAWLMFKDKRGKLRSIGDKLIRNLVFAINDDNKKYKGSIDFEKKKNIITKLSKNFNRIIFLDDDIQNVKAVKKLKLRNVMVKLAKDE
tara:strand:- start:149 stop:778 length:630 start_codon:yes stop_codon:yes gene_type:complete